MLSGQALLTLRQTATIRPTQTTRLGFSREAVAGVISFLLSEQAEAITGAWILVTGRV